MFKINVPYDHTSMEVALEDKNFAGKLEGQQTHFVAEKSQEDLVEESLDNPIGQKSLEELVIGKKDIVIIS